MLAPSKLFMLLVAVSWFAHGRPCSAQNRPAHAQSRSAKQQNSTSNLPCDNPPDLSTFINCRVDQLAQIQVAQKDPAKQTQAPSGSSSATSLVDRSSVSDIAGLALDAAGLSSASSQPNTTSSTGSVDAYALRTWLEHKDPLDPSIYAKGLQWRRFSLLLGRDFADSSKTSGSNSITGASSQLSQVNQQTLIYAPAGSSSTTASGTTTSQRGVIVGAKVVLWARRDASNSHNKSYFDAIGNGLAQEVVPFAKATLAIQAYLDARYGAGSTSPEGWGSTWGRLTSADKTALDKLLVETVATSNSYYKTVNDALTQILSAPQVSATYQADIKLDNGATLHRTALILDKSAFGKSGKILTTTNLGYDYTEKSSISAAKKQFRASADIRFPLWSINNGKDSATIDVSGQGQWGSKSPTYQAQLKLTVPVANGVSIPLSWGYANQTQLLKDNYVFGHIGVTLDLSKLLARNKL
jgi:hypothetical protein